jgi:hypothetical protein
MKAHHPEAEMRLREGRLVRLPAIEFDGQILDPRSAVPARGEAVRAQQLPPGGVGDGQGRAPIGKAVPGGIHPGPLGAAGDKLGGAIADAVA